MRDLTSSTAHWHDYGQRFLANVILANMVSGQQVTGLIGLVTYSALIFGTATCIISPLASRGILSRIPVQHSPHLWTVLGTCAARQTTP
jgi:hypothetical protein